MPSLRAKCGRHEINKLFLSVFVDIELKKTRNNAREDNSRMDDNHRRLDSKF